MLESKVLAKDCVKNLNGSRHQTPCAMPPDVALVAADEADLLIVIEIDIENKLALHRIEGALLDLLVVLWRRRVDRADVDLVRLARLNSLFELTAVAEGEVADVDVIRNREAELSLRKPIALDSGKVWSLGLRLREGPLAFPLLPLTRSGAE